MIKRVTLVLILMISAVLFQCRCNQSGEGDKPDLNPDDSLDKGISVDTEAINEIIQSFSSPVEMAALMNDLNAPFSMRYLVPAGDAANYDTNFKKALALGVLSADLGYLNVYKRTGQIVEYLTVIKRIADDLSVGQFFDFQTLKRLATSNDNLDSLLFLSVHSFHQMDEHLRANSRSNLSALVVTGVWIESLYLSTQVAKESPKKELTERIGEQKFILNNLLPILKIYQKDRNFEQLVEEMTELKDAFEPVEITYIKGEPETKVIDSIVVFIPNEKSIVNMSDATLKNIITITEKVRNKLIAL